MTATSAVGASVATSPDTEELGGVGSSAMILESCLRNGELGREVRRSMSVWGKKMVRLSDLSRADEKQLWGKSNDVRRRNRKSNWSVHDPLNTVEQSGNLSIKGALSLARHNREICCWPL